MNVAVSIDRLDRDTPNGMQRVATETARHLVRQGHDVTIFTLRRHLEPARENRDGVRVVRYDGSNGPVGDAIAGFRALRDLHARRPIDVLHAHFAYCALGPLAASVGNMARVRTYHGAWNLEAIAERPARPSDRFRYGVEWAGLRSAERVIVLSDYARAQIVRAFGVDDARIDRIPGGADLARFAPTEPRSAYRRTFGLDPNAFVIACAGRLVKRKGFDRIIAAFPAILQAIPQAQLLIGGDGAERAALEALIARLGLRERVRLLGHLDGTLADLYRGADVVVVPSLALETFGLVTVEALAAGTPVIGTPIGATPEILRAFDPSLIARNTTSDALGEAVVRFARANTDVAETKIRLKAFTARYSWLNHANAVERVLLQVVDERSRRRLP